MIRKLFAAAVVVLLSSVALAADLKSGPQVGEDVPGPFHPLNVNGEDAGKKACLYCKAGDSPVVAIFARSADDAALKKLIATVEETAAKNPKAELNSFVVFCSNNDKLEEQLKELAEKANLKNVILAIEEPTGPGEVQHQPRRRRDGGALQGARREGQPQLREGQADR